VTPLGQLLIAATPLGNPSDASARLVELLQTADVVAAEDTRRLRRLARDLGVVHAGRVVSYYDATEAARVPELIAALEAGETVLLVSDAGTPGVSDPGYRLVRAAVDAGIPVRPVPGPSAATAALAVSGLAVDRWCFEGFLPRRPGERRRRIAELAGEPRTLVVFEAPHRVARTLTDLAAGFGDARPAAVCRELTKTHEEIRRGPLGELAAWAGAAAPRGEITLVIAGAPEAADTATDPETLAGDVAGIEASGVTRREAITEVAAGRRLPRRVVYAAVVAAREKRIAGPS